MQGPGAGLPIGEARFDAARGTLAAPGGAAVALRPKTLALLQLLLREAGRVVSRAEILDAVWPGVFVTDDSVTQCVVELRQALGPEAARLRTIPKRGYLLDLPAAPAPAAAMPSPRGGGVPVVAMLPLRLPQPEPGLAVFAEGVVEGVVGVLARLREPVVISANSTRRFAGREPDLAAIGQRLGAQYLAVGSLRRAGAGLRLGVELSEAASGVVLWQRSYDLPEAVSTETEDHIAGVIAHTLAPRVQEAELRRSRAAAPSDLGAYHMLLEARRLIFKLERDSFEAAGVLLRQAVRLDPGFAPGHASLADWHSLRVFQGWSENREADAAALAAAAERAIALDPGQGRALALLGHNQTILHRRYEAATSLFARALEAAPNDAEAWLWSAPTYAWMGEGAEAVRRAERAIALSPEDPLRFRFDHFLGIGHYVSGNFEMAAEVGARADLANPRYTSNLRLTAAALAAIGRTEEARGYARRVLDLEPDFRVGPMIAQQALRDPEARARYGRHLVAAGLPE